MAEVYRRGGVSREIRVILDPARMQAHGLTASEVNAQLRQVNLNAAGGRAEIAGSEQSVRILGNAASAHELGETRIAVGDGRTVKLSNHPALRHPSEEQHSLSPVEEGKQVTTSGSPRA